jgi:TRAP-type uncharacterized transport system substrate-binding protein
MLRRTFGLTAAAAAASVFTRTPATAQEMKFFRIGTGGAGGTYFPIGGLLANAISAPPGSTPCDQGGACGVPGLVAIAQTTNASVANVTGVQGGQMESGLAAADIVYQAFNGLGRFERKFDKLRVIANLFPEHMHLVLPKGGKLNGIKDLRGKRVSIFQAGSGTQVVVLELLKIVGGTPLAAISQLAATKGMEIYELTAEERAAFLKVVPYYYEDTIRAGTYEGQTKDIATVAVGAQWVVGAGVADDLVYNVTKALWNDNSRRLFDAGHAKARDIQLAAALKAVNTPLHPGAERFYKEKGVVK